MSDYLNTFMVQPEEYFDTPFVNLFCDAGLCSSRNEARRTAKQGGLYFLDKRVEVDEVFRLGHLKHGAHWEEGYYSTFPLRRGKKNYRLIEIDKENWGLCVLKVTK